MNQNNKHFNQYIEDQNNRLNKSSLLNRKISRQSKTDLLEEKYQLSNIRNAGSRNQSSINNAPSLASHFSIFPKLQDGSLGKGNLPFNPIKRTQMMITQKDNVYDHIYIEPIKDINNSLQIEIEQNDMKDIPFSDQFYLDFDSKTQLFANVKTSINNILDYTKMKDNELLLHIKYLQDERKAAHKRATIAIRNNMNKLSSAADNEIIKNMLNNRK